MRSLAPTAQPKLEIVKPFALPLLFSVALAGCGLFEPIRHDPNLWRTFLGASALLCVWTGVLLAVALASGRRLTLQVALHKHHYLQACVHASIFVYWGWYWRDVYAHAPHILAQLAFAYGFDLLLSWSRRDKYFLGFGPCPVVFSINLFLWFKNDWFYLQLLMVAVGLLVKEFLRWQKDGKSAHIFNPSSFPLALIGVALLAGGWTGHTWGLEISLSQFWPPHMYLFLFLIALPGQYLFGVTSMTLSAVVTTYLFGLGYFAATGTYFFYDSYVPIAVFLGMHLLFTDPSTSPRTELGRLIFGVLYGLSVVALEALGTTYYDKLLAVPLLNLSIKLLDQLSSKAGRSRLFRHLDPAALAPSLTGRRRNLAYMAVWATVFAGMSAVQGVGDDHRGQWLTFWQGACRDHGKRACDHLASMENAYCLGGSGWACNELGIYELVAAHDGTGALSLVRRGCALGFQPACASARSLSSGGPPAHALPTTADYPVILIGSKGVKLTGLSPAELNARACFQGWTQACSPAG